MDGSPGGTRRVPEFALVTGLFLSVTFLIAGIALTGDVVRTLLTAVIILYPFSTYAVRHSADPTTVLPPRATSAAAAVAGAVLAGSVLVAAPPGELATELPYALLLGAGVVTPPAAYHVRYGDRADRLNPLSPVTTVVVTTAVAVGVLGYGLLVGGTVFAAATALITFLAGAVYARARGARLALRTRRRIVAGGAAVGVGVATVGVVRGVATESWLLVGLCVVAAPTIFYALTDPERR